MIRLSDEQWERIRHHFPEEHIPDGRPGRKPIPTRRVLEAVLWILNTGAQGTCCRRAIRTAVTPHTFEVFIDFIVARVRVQAVITGVLVCPPNTLRSAD